MGDDFLIEPNYFVELDKIKNTIAAESLVAENETQTANSFQLNLYAYLFAKAGIKADVFHPETKIEGCLSHNFGVLKKRTSSKGRLDAVVNNLVIEYKNVKKLRKKNDQETAIHQVEDYLEALYKGKSIKYDAVLTDGLIICYFTFDGDKVVHTSFRKIDVNDLDRIIKAILICDRKKFVPQNIKKDFCVNPLANSSARILAQKLYSILVEKPTSKTTMLFIEWQSLMHLSRDDSGKGNDIEKRRKDLGLLFEDDISNPDKEYRALFALQTAYAIIVKLIACKVMDKIDYDGGTKTYNDLTAIDSKDLQKFLEKMEDGYEYKNNKILNLLEGDYFSWYSSKKQWDTELWQSVLKIIKCIDEYTTFSFDVKYVPVDIFRDLYMSIIPKSVRHSMGEYFTPSWLADYVITEGINQQKNEKWKAIDPCCGSGTFIISLIKHIVGSINLQNLTDEEKKSIRDEILSRVYGVDINPLSVLSARVGYYIALKPFGDISDVEIPIYLGDSAIVPNKELVGGVECYKYAVANSEIPFEITLPTRLVKQPDFGTMMSSLQKAVISENASDLKKLITKRMEENEKKSKELDCAISNLAEKLVELHKRNWDGIWVRIATNFMMIARLEKFDLIVGNPPWVKWEHLPTKYAERIKAFCNIRHIFTTRGRFGGTQLNICALISNVVANNWLEDNGVLAFLMPDSLMSQNSYEEFRYFYLNYEEKERLYLQKIDKWEAPLRPFRCDNTAISQDFNTYYYSKNKVNYTSGIEVTTISRNTNVLDDYLNSFSNFMDVKKHLVFGKMKAAQLSPNSSAFSYLSEEHDFKKIIGNSDYEYRTGVEFTPQELFMLEGVGPSKNPGHFLFTNRKFKLSKYIVDDAPTKGWDLPVDYIYPIMTGPSITPFKNECINQFCILPYNPKKPTTPVKSDELLTKHEELYDYLVSHKELIDSQSEKSKQMRVGNEFYSLSKIGPYTFGKYIVAARDNTKFCASVIEDKETPWGGKKTQICVKHTIIISRDLTGRFISEDEAYYICGILNSTIIISYMKNTFKTNGFSLKKSSFALPLYDMKNEVHKEIVTLSKIASKENDENVILDIQQQITKLYLKICS